MWIRYRQYANGSPFCCCTFLHLHSLHTPLKRYIQFAYTFVTIIYLLLHQTFWLLILWVRCNRRYPQNTNTHIIANDSDSSCISNAITRHVWLLEKFNNELWIWHLPHRQKQSGLSRTVHFSEETYIYFLCFSHLEWQRRLKYFLMLYTDLINLHSQYQGCWWPGDAMIHGFSDHDMGPFKPG